MAFPTSQVSPSDAIVTLRSLRRRFAEAFDQAPDPGQLAAGAGGDLSPIGHATGTATALEAIGAALHAVQISDHPAITLPSGGSGSGGSGSGGSGSGGSDSGGSGSGGSGGSGSGGSDSGAAAGAGATAALADLGAVAGRVADAMAEVHGDAWSRPGVAESGEVTALDIARLGVRIAIEHLRATEQIIAGLRA